MKISAEMNLQQLEAIMGDGLHEHDVRSMRDVLVERFDGQDTIEVPDAGWDDAWSEATARVMARPGLWQAKDEKSDSGDKVVRPARPKM